MAKPVLHYFPIRGRGEPIRLAFQDCRIDFEEHRVTDFASVREPWFTEGKLEFGQLPLLEDEDGNHVQLGAILRHIGRKYNLYGKNEAEMARVDRFLEGVSDVRSAYLQLIYQDRVADEKLREFSERIGKLVPGSGALLLGIERMVERYGGPFAVLDTVSVADYSLFDLVDNLKRIMPDIDTRFPAIARWYEHMASRPNLKAYLDSNPAHRETVNANGLG